MRLHTVWRASGPDCETGPSLEELIWGLVSHIEDPALCVSLIGLTLKGTASARIGRLLRSVCPFRSLGKNTCRDSPWKLTYSALQWTTDWPSEENTLR